MNETDTNITEQDLSDDNSVLTEREQEVFKLLLDGKSSKEIEDILNLSGGTVNTHRNNLYKKLGISSINELFGKYTSFNASEQRNNTKTLSLKFLFPAILVIAAGLAAAAALVWNSISVKAAGGTEAVFDFWFAMGDEKGSSFVTRQKEIVNGKEEWVVSISGIQETNDIKFSGVYGRPSPKTLEEMRSMESISFSYMGDGKRYYIGFPTIETIEYNSSIPIGKDEVYGEHWMIILETVKDELSTVNINIPDDLIWLDENDGKPPFILVNLNCMQIQPADTGDYCLKWWNIMLNGN